MSSNKSYLDDIIVCSVHRVKRSSQKGIVIVLSSLEISAVLLSDSLQFYGLVVSLFINWDSSMVVFYDPSSWVLLALLQLVVRQI